MLTSGTLDTAVGAYALRNNTTGQFNTAFGTYALFTNTTNGSNTAVGHSALYFNTAAGITAVGYSALTNNTTGNDNVAMGYTALSTNKAARGNRRKGTDKVGGSAMSHGRTLSGISVSRGLDGTAERPAGECGSGKTRRRNASGGTRKLVRLTLTAKHKDAGGNLISGFHRVSG